MSSLDAPIQTETARMPFEIVANKQQYSIIPKFDYELSGVVVTYNNADGFTDIWHHDVWKDFINVRDLCVIWGSNVSTGIYKKISFVLAHTVTGLAGSMITLSIESSLITHPS